MANVDMLHRHKITEERWLKGSIPREAQILYPTLTHKESLYSVVQMTRDAIAPHAKLASSVSATLNMMTSSDVLPVWIEAGQREDRGANEQASVRRRQASARRRAVSDASSEIYVELGGIGTDQQTREELSEALEDGWGKFMPPEWRGGRPHYLFQATRALTVLKNGHPSSLPKIRQLLMSYVREVAGNPFRPVEFSPTWRTGTVTAMANGMYDTQDFSAMPILADALQDAGCENEDVLNHCRQMQSHFRGCWVVEEILGRRS